MIKIANNIQRMLAKQAANTNNPQIMYSPELGGFHTPGTYPQSMLPEEYQNHQARKYINAHRFDDPAYFNSAEDFASALNTSGIANVVSPQQFQRALAEIKNDNIEYGSKTPADYGYDLIRGRAAEAYMSPKRKPGQPAVMPAADIMSRSFNTFNNYDVLQEQMAENRLSESFKPLHYAVYDATPDNPTGRTAANPISDAQVANIASQKVKDYMKSISRPGYVPR